ncbi:MAG TPA: class I SAM-dependent methyltransferase [Acidimicrobiales bacterium]|nr:class I SAM-dependent methyltransferase [Acidimicrobiales bacterium]
MESEQGFHDHAFEHGTRSKVGRFYRVLNDCSAAYEDKLMGLTGPGVDILEYGCGVGTDAFALAKAGAVVTAIDISEEGIRQTRDRAAAEGLTISCRQMNAEDLEFDSSTFGVVCGRGILHHLDLDRAFGELRRVMKPDGIGIFMEPLGHNPMINLFRRLTPSLRTPDEHPLLLRDFELAKTYFDQVEVQFYGLFPLLALPAPDSKLTDRLVARLSSVDAAVLPKIGKAAGLAWYAIIKMSDPRPIR